MGKAKNLYEKGNHLQNVLVVVSDKKLAVDSDGNGIIDYYNADVVTANDMYSGGMIMPGRKFAQGNSNYRYSINGQEKENELNENITTAQYWEYDSRIVRRWNRDPEGNESESPYLCFYGNPIQMMDPLGNKPYDDKYRDRNTGKLIRTVKTSEGGDRIMDVLTPSGGKKLQDLTVDELKANVSGGIQMVAHKGYNYDVNTGQFVKNGTQTPQPTPSQAPVNTKPVPNNNATAQAPDIISKPVQNTMDVVGAVSTTTQAVSSGFLRAARAAKSSGTLGNGVLVGIPSSLSAKAPNVFSLGRVNASAAIKVTNAAKVVDIISKPLSVASGVVNIVKDGKLTAGDAGVAALTYAQIAFPAFGLAVGVFDIGSLIFGYKSSSDLIHDAIDGTLPNHGINFTGTKR